MSFPSQFLYLLGSLNLLLISIYLINIPSPLALESTKIGKLLIIPVIELSPVDQNNKSSTENQLIESLGGKTSAGGGATDARIWKITVNS